MLVLLTECGGAVTRPVRLLDRIAARLHAHRLDTELASGIAPDATVALALRAQLLVSRSARHDLARSAERIMAAALREPGADRLQIPICRDRIRESSRELAELIRCLRAADPVPARGVAMASLLLGDAGGPLYNRASADDLRARVRAASDALSPLSALWTGTAGPG